MPYAESGISKPRYKPENPDLGKVFAGLTVLASFRLTGLSGRIGRASE